jgi:hypothetical protein
VNRQLIADLGSSQTSGYQRFDEFGRRLALIPRPTTCGPALPAAVPPMGSGVEPGDQGGHLRAAVPGEVV